MTISMYGITVPVFTRMLTNLLVLLDKAEVYAGERKFGTEVLVEARLAPDMFPLRAQIMIATDHAKGAVSRLAGQPVPSWPDTETSFAELRGRIQKALDLLATVKPEDLAGSEDRDIAFKVGGKDVVLNGLDYVQQRALPNFYFHVTTAYDILRHNGVALSKRDFIG